MLDASVVLKWLFADPDYEPLTDEATALIEEVVDQSCALQPIHWLAEVGGAMARKTPKSIETNLQLLDGLGWEIADSIEIMQRAGRLAVDLDHHFFDTLYHAVALECGTVLITADRRYLAKARSKGGIVGLPDWRNAVNPA